MPFQVFQTIVIFVVLLTFTAVKAKKLHLQKLIYANQKNP